MDKNLEKTIKTAVANAIFPNNKDSYSVYQLLLEENNLSEELSDFEKKHNCSLNSEWYFNFDEIHEALSYEHKFAMSIFHTLKKSYIKSIGLKAEKESYEEILTFVSNEEQLKKAAIRSIFALSVNTDETAFIDDLLEVDDFITESLSKLQHCHCGYEHSTDIAERYFDSLKMANTMKEGIAEYLSK